MRTLIVPDRPNPWPPILFLQRKARDYHVVPAALQTFYRGVEGFLEPHQQRVPIRARNIGHDVGITVAGPEGVDAVNQLPVRAAVRGLVKCVVGSRNLCAFGPADGQPAESAVFARCRHAAVRCRTNCRGGTSTWSGRR